jgi:CBS-domain-containing membrane protein
VIYCFEEDDVQKAAELMQARKLRRLMVLDRDKRLVGIVMPGDLAVKTGEGKTPAETLSKISEPSQPKR